MTRTVLVIKDQRSIRNLIHILLSAQWLEPSEIRRRDGLADIAGSCFGSVLLDLRPAAESAADLPAGILRMRHTLFGGVLYVSGEVSDFGIVERIRRDCLTRVRRVSIFYEMWDRLRLLFHLAPSESV